jgi:hypothetical protein
MASTPTHEDAAGVQVDGSGTTQTMADCTERRQALVAVAESG